MASFNDEWIEALNQSQVEREREEIDQRKGKERKGKEMSLFY